MIGMEQFMHFFQMLFRQLSTRPKFYIQARFSFFIAILIFSLATTQQTAAASYRTSYGSV